MRRVVVTVLALSLVALASACGQGSASTGQTEPSKSFNQADTDFAIAMQSHHQQALTMAEMAQAKAATPEVRKLAREIAAAQGPEIDRMASWIRQWSKHGAKLPGHGDQMHAEGMMSGQDMRMLRQSSGKEFDRMWLEMMIEHHRGAIAMAQDHRSAGRHPGAARMADEIARTQQQEIDQMQRMLRQLSMQ